MFVAKDSTLASTTGGNTTGVVRAVSMEVPAADASPGLAELSKRELAQQRRSLLMKLFADTGTAKIPAVLR